MQSIDESSISARKHAEWQVRHRQWGREAELHYQLERDKKFMRNIRRNKIKDPKKSFERKMSQYKKGNLSKEQLRAQPEYESFAFKKWMR